MSTICQIYTSWTTKNIPKTVVIAFLTAGQIRAASRLAKANNIVFPLSDETIGHISNLKSAIGREFGNRVKMDRGRNRLTFTTSTTTHWRVCG